MYSSCNANGDVLLLRGAGPVALKALEARLDRTKGLLYASTDVADRGVEPGFLLSLLDVSNGGVVGVLARALLAVARFGRGRDNLDSAFEVLLRRRKWLSLMIATPRSEAS